MVGDDARRVAEDRVTHVVKRVGQDDLDEAQAERLHPEDQQGVGEVGEAEQRQEDHHPPVPAGQRAPKLPSVPVNGRRDRLPNEPDQRHARRRGDERHEEQGPDPVVQSLVEGQPCKGAYHRSGGIQRAIESERPTTMFRSGVGGDQCISRRRPQPLAEPIGEPSHQHERPPGGEADHEFGQ